MSYLVFQLYAPLSSWGILAGSESRPTQKFPTRSAILGLLAAALGIKRAEQERLSELNKAVGYACKSYSQGSLQRDFHTTEAGEGGVRYFSRKRELNAKTTTILSYRDYCENGFWTVAIWLKDKQIEYTLEQLCQALQHPAFTLYLGRKSCPLALPLAPKIVDHAENLKGVLDSFFIELFHDKNTKLQQQTQVKKPLVSLRQLPLNTIERGYWVHYHWEESPDKLTGETSLTGIETHSYHDYLVEHAKGKSSQRIGYEWVTQETFN